MIRIAYLMLVHRNPRLLERLITALSSEYSSSFIHIDRKTDVREFSGIGGNNIFISEPRISVYWGEFSQVDATMQLIRQALERPEKYDYFILLHGADYQLRSSTYINKFFEMNCGGEFISLVKMPVPGYPLSKINKVRYPSEKPFRRFASRALAKFGLAHRDYRKQLGDIDAYAGDACWALSRAACQYIVDFTDRNPQVERYFRKTFTSDETFFHTLIGNSPFLHHVRRGPLYTDWSIPGRGFHPTMINETHVSHFGKQEQVWISDQFGSGEALFARKFSDDNLDLLDRIDAMITRKEGQG
jgi:Core-2/I-Branching enzyme